MLDRRFLNLSLVVQGIVNEPIPNPSLGTQYIVGASPNGAFTNATPNSIAHFNGSAWNFIIPHTGSLEVLNLENSEILQFNGTLWVTVATLGGEPIAPVLAIIPTGDTLPDSASAGDTFLNTDDAKLYTATAANTWDSGTLTSNSSRYASSSDFKVYQSNGSTLSVTNILNGDLFINKENGIAYVYDASIPAFVKIGGGQEFVTEIHTLTAAEATAKTFSLENSIAFGKESSILLFVSGVAQAYGIDFSASGNLISWDDKALEDIGLAAGDLFIIHYIKA